MIKIMETIFNYFKRILFSFLEGIRTSISFFCAKLSSFLELLIFKKFTLWLYTNLINLYKKYNYAIQDLFKRYYYIVSKVYFNLKQKYPNRLVGIVLYFIRFAVLTPFLFYLIFYRFKNFCVFLILRVPLYKVVSCACHKYLIFTEFKFAFFSEDVKKRWRKKCEKNYTETQLKIYQKTNEAAKQRQSGGLDNDVPISLSLCTPKYLLLVRIDSLITLKTAIKKKKKISIFGYLLLGRRIHVFFLGIIYHFEYYKFCVFISPSFVKVTTTCQIIWEYIKEFFTIFF